MSAVLTALWPKVSVHVDGEDHVVARGRKLPKGVDRETALTLVQIGAAAYVEPVDADDLVDSDDVVTFDGPPAKSATTDVWRAFHVSQGADPGEAAKAKKKDLVALYLDDDGAAGDDSDAGDGDGDDDQA